MTEELIAEILSHPYFDKDPVVLLDIGASGNIHSDWVPIAPFSTCIAFDADDREFSDNVRSPQFKKLHLVNKIVSASSQTSIPFYLTRSPFCSSTLQPLEHPLQSWAFHKRFEVEKQISLPGTQLANVLAELNIKHIDWFKTDSQGTDLRLFSSLPSAIQKNILIAEFEPGIIDAYKDEDKLWHVLSYMDKMPFWVADLNVQGTKRIHKKVMEQLGVEEDSGLQLPTCSCWGEITYINDFREERSMRDLLVGWVFSTIRGQHGFALEILVHVPANSPDKAIVEKMRKFSEHKLLTPPERSLKTRIRDRLIHYLNKW